MSGRDAMLIDALGAAINQLLHELAESGVLSPEAHFKVFEAYEEAIESW